MIIDMINGKGEALMRYETDCCPRVLETISMLKPEEKLFIVLKVNHFISPRNIGYGEMYQQLVTITVEEVG